MINLLPLQTYLGILAMSLSSSQKAMQSLKEGSLELNASLQKEGQRLQKALSQKRLPELEKELNKQITEKITACMEAIPIFCRELEAMGNWAASAPVIWQEGSTRLYEYKHGGNSSIPVLIIPSLINRHYILDLEENNSFVKYIAAHGADTYLASWGEPEEDELGFSLDQYIGRIEKMVDLVHKKTGQKVVLAGYCMGGLLALAAAQRKSKKIKALAFLATPWNFHAEAFPRFNLNNDHLEKVETFIRNCNKVPAVIVQSLFYYLHANLVGQKFEMYPLSYKNLSKTSFLAVENWANDGISMTSAVARECFISWVNNNDVAAEKWKIAGRAVSPEIVKNLPAFFAIPKRDSVVPEGCAMPLAEYFKRSTIIQPDAGHVGMLVGNSAQSQTWEPFVRWLEGLSN